MMLSPADYAAYSRATGQPYPQSEEDKVQMYGDVREFRGNQIKQPQNSQGNSLLNAVAVGAGVLGTGALAAYALRGRKPSNSRRGGVNMADNPLPSKPSADIQNLARTSAPDIQQAAASNSYTDSIADNLKQRGGDFNSNTFIQGATVSNAVQGAKGSGFNAFSQRATQIGQDASKAKAKNFADAAVESMVQIQDEREPLIRQQSVEALDTASDQGSMGLQSATQRNVEVDTGAIDFDNAAAQLFTEERQQIAESLLEQGVNPTRGAIETNMAERFGPKSSEYGSDYTRTKQDMQIYATYGGDFGGDNVVIGGRDVPVSELKTEFVSPATARYVEGQRENVKDFVGDVRLDTTMQRNRRIKADPEKYGDISYVREYSPQELRRIAGAENWAAEEQARITQEFPKRLADNYQEGSYFTVAKDDATGKLLATIDQQTGEITPVMTRTSGGLRSVQNVADKTPEGRGAKEKLDVRPASGTSIRGRSAATIEGIPGGVGIYGMEAEGRPSGALLKDTPGVLTPEGNFIPNTELSRQRPTEMYYNKDTVAQRAIELGEAERYSGPGTGDVPTSPATYQEALDSLLADERVGPQPYTAEEAQRLRSSVNMSEAIRKAARDRANRNPRGGAVPQELEILRRTMPQGPRATERPTGPRSVSPSKIPPQQLTLPRVNAYEARQRASSADMAAAQLESYMAGLQRGRATPLTSEVVIQPQLF